MVPFQTRVLSAGQRQRRRWCRRRGSGRGDIPQLLCSALATGPLTPLFLAECPGPEVSVLDVQVIPSGEVLAVVDVFADRNTPPFHATVYAVACSVRVVHVTPSGDVAADVLL